jgi:hypothetical protein
MDVRNMYITGMNFDGDTTLQPVIDVLTDVAKTSYVEGWNSHAQLANLIKSLFFDY